jgi:DNA-binding transcriptional MerR regulator
MAVKRLRFIKQAQRLGFSLSDIRHFLSIREQGDLPFQCVMRVAEKTLQETEQKIPDLKKFASLIRKNLAQWKERSTAKRKAVSAFCDLIEQNKATLGRSEIQRE